MPLLILHNYFLCLLGLSTCHILSSIKISTNLLSYFCITKKSYEEDLWIEIAKCLDGKSIIMLAATCHWFKRIMMEECVWKFACLRDLQVLEPHKVAFKWNKLYATTFGKKAWLPFYIRNTSPYCFSFCCCCGWS